ncbi:hypothetical protein CVT24_007659 [Panaeolus cyanescens]|uniref:Uncharacterized protein n=1 Tax=Panaeolus cyanescens TaxID=181874 RepID=A0A409YKY2_9AGAR|nr:hypothetical protein CVT24_007659 [Panaeolus cyanescens]
MSAQPSAFVFSETSFWDSLRKVTEACERGMAKNGDFAKEFQAVSSCYTYLTKTYKAITHKQLPKDTPAAIVGAFGNDSPYWSLEMAMKWKTKLREAKEQKVEAVADQEWLDHWRMRKDAKVATLESSDDETQQGATENEASEKEVGEGADSDDEHPLSKRKGKQRAVSDAEEDNPPLVSKGKGKQVPADEDTAPDAKWRRRRLDPPANDPSPASAEPDDPPRVSPKTKYRAGGQLNIPPCKRCMEGNYICAVIAKGLGGNACFPCGKNGKKCSLALPKAKAAAAAAKNRMAAAEKRKRAQDSDTDAAPAKKKRAPPIRNVDLLKRIQKMEDVIHDLNERITDLENECDNNFADLARAQFQDRIRLQDAAYGTVILSRDATYAAQQAKAALGGVEVMYPTRFKTPFGQDMTAAPIKLTIDGKVKVFGKPHRSYMRAVEVRHDGHYEITVPEVEDKYIPMYKVMQKPSSSQSGFRAPSTSAPPFHPQSGAPASASGSGQSAYASAPASTSSSSAIPTRDFSNLGNAEKRIRFDHADTSAQRTVVAPEVPTPCTPPSAPHRHPPSKSPSPTASATAPAPTPISDTAPTPAPVSAPTPALPPQIQHVTSSTQSPSTAADTRSATGPHPVHHTSQGETRDEDVVDYEDDEVSAPQQESDMGLVGGDVEMGVEAAALLEADHVFSEPDQPHAADGGQEDRPDDMQVDPSHENEVDRAFDMEEPLTPQATSDGEDATEEPTVPVPAIEVEPPSAPPTKKTRATSNAGSSRGNLEPPPRGRKSKRGGRGKK